MSENLFSESFCQSEENDVVVVVIVVVVDL